MQRSTDFNLVSTFIIFVILVLIAYAPTLQYDFATSDQWRAFRLPEWFSHITDFKTCFSHAVPFYIQTGRALVWFSECIERAFVTEIGDYYFFRVFPFILTVLIIYFLGRLLRIASFKQHISAYAAGTLVVILPGYQFMLMLGTNGFMVLVSLFLCVCSASAFYSSHVEQKSNLRKKLTPFILYIAACFIYPAWALGVVPLLFFLLLTTSEITKSQKLFKIVYMVGLYFVTTMLYLALTKLFVFINLFGAGELVLTGTEYALEFQTDVGVLMERFFSAIVFLTSGALWGIANLKTIVFIVGFLSLYLLIHNRLNPLPDNNILSSYFVSLLLSLVLGLLFILAPTLPWIFSAMGHISERFVTSAYLLPILCVGGAFDFLCNRKKNPYAQYIPIAVVAFVVFSVHRISTVNVFASITEINYIQSKTNHWLDSGSYEREKVVALVYPSGEDDEARPSYISKQLNHDNIDYITGRWSEDYNHYFEVFSAVIREHANHPVGRSIGLVNCILDYDCLYERRNIAAVRFILFNEEELDKGHVELPSEPLVINMSSLTNNSMTFDYQIAQPTWPVISSSSQHKNFGAAGLLELESPGWHAEVDPIYPQTITVDLRMSRSINGFGLLPQLGHANRMPKNVRLITSNDGEHWEILGTYDDLCIPENADEWHYENLIIGVEARYLKFEIHSNCGDPNLLTLRGLKISPSE